MTSSPGGDEVAGQPDDPGGVGEPVHVALALDLDQPAVLDAGVQLPGAVDGHHLVGGEADDQGGRDDAGQPLAQVHLEADLDLPVHARGPRVVLRGGRPLVAPAVQDARHEALQRHEPLVEAEIGGAQVAPRR
ncbi:hypothetical protein [Nonomuraea montanisoli]|uniref:hypothetical protein n=1 Tax=Nonomuraea montanisoli TaxID=2741721 RepID=UPI001F1FA8FF|nr:hypothetical protein [Nonomuraea montanisoli]